jgi:MFS family permease
VLHPTTTTDPNLTSRLFTPAFVALALAELAYFTAAGLMIPLTPLFAAGPLGANEVGVGLTVGAFSVTALLLRPIAGRSADRRGRRPLLVGGALLFAVVTALHMFTGDLAVLVVLRLLLGVAEAFFFVAGFAALADLAPAGRAGEALSFNSLSLYLGIALGPMVGEYLLGSGGFPLAWMGGAALALLAAVIALGLPETLRRDETVAQPPPLVNRAAIAPALGLFSGIAGMAGFFAFVAIHARNLGMDGAGGVLLVFGLIVVGARVVFARLPDRVPPFRLGAAALALIAAGLTVAGAVQSQEGLLAGAAILAVGVAFSTPAFFAAIFARVPASERGSASGTTSIFLDLAFGGGPALLGFVAGSAGIPGAFAVAAALAALGAVGTLALAYSGQRRTVSATVD